MKNYIIKPLIFFIITINSILFSQNSVISGTVIDSVNGNALIGANVVIKGTSLGVATDADGKYKLTNITEGDYIVKVTYIGYKKETKALNVTGSKNITLDFALDYTTVEGKTVVVTAQAKGQMDAINRQLKAKSIKNIVSSDRIQELPESNAAEAVARIPGVSIRREGGEGNKVVIRGLSPKYNRVTVNGTNLASTDTSDRSTDVSMISQYMLEGIEVTKAGTPDQEGDVLGGTINFILKKAKPGLHGDIITQGIYNGLEKTSDDYKYVMSIGNRFLNDRLGILAQLDIENRTRSSHDLRGSYVNSPAYLDSLNALQLMNLSLTDMVRNNDRNNTLVVMDVNIPRGNISYSGLNSKIDKTEIRFSDVYMLQAENRGYNTGQSDNQINVITESWKYEQSILPNLRLDAFKSFSLSKNDRQTLNFNFTEEDAYTEAVINKSVDNIQDFTINNTNAAYWMGSNFRENYTKETESSFGGNLEYDFNFNNKVSGKIKLGFKSRDKSRNHDQDYEYTTWVTNNSALNERRDSAIVHFDWLDEWADPGYQQINYKAFMDEDYDLSDYFDGRYEIGPAADLDKMISLIDLFRSDPFFYNAGYHEQRLHKFHKTNSLIFDYSGTEDYDAKYMMIDFNIGPKLNVIAGSRIEDNITIYKSFKGMQNTFPDFSSSGSDTISTFTRKNSYTLPSLFLKYDPYEWLSLRYASTSTLTRPSYADIIPLYNYRGNFGEVLYRNRFLEPAESKNNDYVISFNDEKLGLLSFSYFTKKIEGMIYSSGRRYIVEGGADSLYGLPHYTDKQFITDYRSNNPYPVDLSGYEIDYQTRFWYLPGMLSGLVFNANYTRTFSEVKYPRTEIDYIVVFTPTFSVNTVNIDSFYVDRLIDQPNDIFNLSLGYDYKGFSGRLSMLYMSDVFTSTNFWPELRQTTDAYRRYDLSMKQELPVKGLELYLNVSNLTEAIDVNRLRGFNKADRAFTNAILEDVQSADAKNIDERLDLIPVEARAKALEQHYGSTIDIGFRYSF